MKMNALLTLLLVAVVVLAAGCEPEAKPKPKGPAAAAKWESKIGGSYKGIIYTGQTEYPGTTTFQVDKKGGLSGTYELMDEGTKVTGKLSDFRIVAKNKLECKWVDTNGTGAFKVTFKDDLSSFKGTWNNDDNEEWSDWNGKK